MSSDTISFPEILKQSFESNIADFHTCLPAIVESYDRSKQKVTVQPALKRKYSDGRVVNLPIINSVPVIFPRSKNRFFHFDLEKGDVVTLVFCERSLDKWKAKGGIVSPDDRRKANLSDAYAIPGGYDFTNAFAPIGAANSLELNNGGTHILIESDGKIVALNSNSSVTLLANGQIDIKNLKATATLKTTGDVDIINEKLTVNMKNTGDVDILNTNLTINLKDSGKVSIANATGELISLISDTLTEIISARTLTLLGMQPLIGLSQTFPAIKILIDTFKV